MIVMRVVRDTHDLSNQRFGRLVVQEKIGVLWLCMCDCGNIKHVSRRHPKQNQTKSCGCLNREERIKLGKSKRTHGLSNAPTYISWSNMLQRCMNPKNKRYEDYGGRGITVCERWTKFENFLADMGIRPEGLTLDRRDNDKGYYKENCRWSTNIEQHNNTRPVPKVSFPKKIIQVSK